MVAPTVAQEHTLAEKYLLERAIPFEVARLARWEAEIHNGREAICFPTATGPRWRYLTGEGSKYHQNVGYAACWYGLDRAVIIGAKQQYVLDCNGAASTLSGQAHCLPAFSLMSGETALPSDELMEALKRKWHHSIFVAFDNDDAGRRGAEKRVRLYRKHGFECEAFDLSLDLQGQDLADFCRIHPEDTYHTLVKCDFLIIEDEPEPPRPPSGGPYTPRNDDPEDKYTLAGAALNAVHGWRRDAYDTWYEVGMCLQELGDAGLALWESWSASGEGYKPGECVRKWRSFKKSGLTIKTLYHMADTDSGTSWRPRHEHTARPEPELVAPVIRDEPQAQRPVRFDNGIPVGIRAAINAFAAPAVGPVLEVWFEGLAKGLIADSDPVDAQYIQCISECLDRNLTINTCRMGLKKALTGQFLTNSALVLFFHSKNLIDDQNQESFAPACEKPKPGRKSILYYLPTRTAFISALAKLAIEPIIEKHFPLKDGVLAPIRAEFFTVLGYDELESASMQRELEARHKATLEAQPRFAECLTKGRRAYGKLLKSLDSDVCAPIPDGVQYTNSIEYMAQCARALIVSLGGNTQLSREKLCEMIGCKLSNLATVLRRGGIEVLKKQTVDVPLVGKLEAMKKPRGKNDKAAYDFDIKGTPTQVWSSANKKPYVYDYHNPGMYKWAAEELARGGTLAIRYSQANRQRIAEPKPLPAPVSAFVHLFREICKFILLKTLYLAGLAQMEMFPEPDGPTLTNEVTLPAERADKEAGPKRRQKIPYARDWFAGIVSLATNLEVRYDESAVDRDTGELFDFTVQLGYAALLKGGAA